MPPDYDQRALEGAGRETPWLTPETSFASKTDVDTGVMRVASPAAEQVRGYTRQLALALTLGAFGLDENPGNPEARGTRGTPLSLKPTASQ